MSERFTIECMYRRPKFLEVLDEIRQEMSREADYDVDLFAEIVRREVTKSLALTESAQKNIGSRPLKFATSPGKIERIAKIKK